MAEPMQWCVLNQAWCDEPSLPSDVDNVLSWAYINLRNHLSDCQTSRIQLLESEPYSPFFTTKMSASANFHAYSFLPPDSNVRKWQEFEKDVLDEMNGCYEDWELRPRCLMDPHSHFGAIIGSCESDLLRPFMQLLDMVNFMLIEDTKVERWSSNKIFFWSGRVTSEWLENKLTGVPDGSTYVLFYNTKTGRHEYAFSPLGFEGKTTDALPGSTYKHVIDNKPVFSQVCGYMHSNNLQMAVLTCLTYTWFIKVADGNYLVSDGIPYNTHVVGASNSAESPTLLQCLYYVSREVARQVLT